MTENETPKITVGSVTSAKIADGAIQGGDIIEALRNGDPKMIEALILTALSRTTLNGMTDLGRDDARRFLDLYRNAHAHELAEQQRAARPVAPTGFTHRQEYVDAWRDGASFAADLIDPAAT